MIRKLTISFCCVLVLVIGLSTSSFSVTLIHLPDFTNQNHLSSEQQKMADKILGRIRKENPDALLVTGDLINGYTLEERLNPSLYLPAKVREHFKHLYQIWSARVDGYKFRVLPALGDHELGDLPLGNILLQTYLLPTYRQAYKDSFNLPQNGPKGEKELAYYISWNHTLLITLNTFSRDGYFLKPQISSQQLQWLKRILRDTNKKNIIVQGHVPIVPIGICRSSSHLLYRDSTDSKLWQIMKTNDVDLYLCGELHTTNLTKQGGIVQVINNGHLGTSEISYTVIRTGTNLTYEIKRIKR